ncbi:PIG-L deacetylase family protein [Pseudanabaena sp. PCC 6802]|uniref:PIG-L deacetylase family protein n=1 Tax=Pseudanabaena sp. PCC 6802 TaxID=118173 RepID=UPI00034B0ECC|nr:PIG-L deacetylase family protein [Pseudanabaena sp. PCC 6802]
MINLLNNRHQNPIRQLLCLGAHSDDVEIGCGGTILKLIETYPDISIYWIVFGAADKRQEEALASAHAFLKDVEHKTIVVKGFRDRFFPYIGADIKNFFDQLSKDVQPDLVLTHYRHDLHQDHRVISDLTWNTFRNHLILEYEIPKYDGDMGIPNIFVHLNESICQRKINYLMEYFATQSNKHWFSSDTFLSILRLRGIESNAPDKYAEAFYCRKAVLI